MSRLRAVPWGELARLAALVLIAGLPRLLFLDADPPADLHVHFITDEGWWAHNARQAALFGRWIMDDHNSPLWSAPAYSFLLWLVYRIAGVGLYQTRLLSGLAGVVVCLAVYGFVRREATPRVAFLAALLLAVGYFLLSNNRVAFTESVQLAFAVLTILAALRSRAAPGWAVVSAAGLLFALASKLSALPAALVIVALYASWLLPSRGSPLERALPRRSALVFLASLAAGSAVLALTFLAPHWAAVVGELRSNTLIATDPHLPTGGGIRPLLWLGFREEPGGPNVMSGFLVQEAALVLSVALLALARLLGRARRPLGELERCCWWWIAAGLAFLALQTYHPDRRYLLFVPPFAILLALAAGTVSPPRDPAGPPRRLPAWRWLAAWGVSGLVAGLYLRAWIVPLLSGATARLKLGAEAGLSPAALHLLVWAGSFLLAAGALWLWARWGTLRRLTLPGALLLGVVLAGDLARDVAYARHLRFSTRDVSRAIGRLAARLPADRRALVGNTSDTLALETDLFAFVVRDWEAFAMHMNVDGLRRFRPGLAIVTERNGRPVGGDEGFSVAGMKVVRVFDHWLDAAGRPGLRTVVYATAEAVR